MQVVGSGPGGPPLLRPSLPRSCTHGPSRLCPIAPSQGSPQWRARPEAGPAFVEGGEGRRRTAGEPASEPDGCREGGGGGGGGVMASTVAGWKQAAAAAATKAAAAAAAVTVSQPTKRFRMARARHLRRGSASEPSGGGPGAGGSALFRPAPKIRAKIRAKIKAEGLELQLSAGGSPAPGRSGRPRRTHGHTPSATASAGDTAAAKAGAAGRSVSAAAAGCAGRGGGGGAAACGCGGARRSPAAGSLLLHALPFCAGSRCAHGSGGIGKWHQPQRTVPGPPHHAGS